MAITAIKVGNQTVTDRNQIVEFMNNAETKMFNQVRDFLADLRSQSETKPLQIQCNESKCGHKFEQTFTLDMSNFFAQGS